MVLHGDLGRELAAEVFGDALGCVHLRDALEVRDNEDQDGDQGEFYDDLAHDERAVAERVDGMGYELRHDKAERADEHGKDDEKGHYSPVRLEDAEEVGLLLGSGLWGVCSGFGHIYKFLNAPVYHIL